jgi:hypothetical protein
MKVVPDLIVTRYAQLKAGELFLYSHEKGLSVAIAAANPVELGDLYIVTLGPKFPPTMTGPTIHSPNGSSSLLSYGGEYVLRLPAGSQAWSSEPPAAGLPCVAVAQEDTYIRANAAPPGRGFHPCYVSAKQGRILGSGTVMQYFPLRDPIFALEWEILTTEEKPRTILSCPFEA